MKKGILYHKVFVENFRFFPFIKSLCAGPGDCEEGERCGEEEARGARQGQLYLFNYNLNSGLRIRLEFTIKNKLDPKIFSKINPDISAA